jgi:hypothetical protein
MLNKEEKHPVEYNYIEKHYPLALAKQITISSILKKLKTNNDTIKIEFDDYYTDAEKLRDDIVLYIRNEKQMECEAVDFNHFIINGERFILNVTHGIHSPGGNFIGQSTTLYKEDNL